MKYSALLALAALVSVGACRDARQSDQVRAASDPVTPAFSTAEQADAYAGKSSVCVSFMQRRDAAAAAGDAESAADLAALVSSTCE
ncbi:MAG TPA: hypothetical protein VHG51_20405 [Longimicrobiaceae bacterium]|nr:hypothetical protein [Longimicrobiaceae bacterium]